MSNELHDFLDKNENSTIYHTPEWGEVIEKTFGYKFFKICSRDEEGRIDGFLPLYHVKSPITKDRLIAGTFKNEGGPLYENVNSFERLMDEGKILMGELECDIMLLKCHARLPPYEGLSSSSRYIKSSLAIDRDSRRFWKGFEPSTRKGVRKAEKEGVEVEFTTDIDDVRSFYEIFAKTRKRLGIPVFSFKFFKNMRQALKEDFMPIIARYKDEPIAGSIFLRHKNIMTYAYSGSLMEYKKMKPNNLILWSLIKHACENGIKEVDFESDHITQKSLLKFKRQWGTKTAPSYQYFLGEGFDLFQMTPKILRNAWSILPLGLTRTIGPKVIGHFG